VLDPVRLTEDVPEELRHRVGVGLAVALRHREGEEVPLSLTENVTDTEAERLAVPEGEALTEAESPPAPPMVPTLSRR